MVRIVFMLLGMVACGADGTPQQVCERYASSFAQAAAVRCERGSIEDNMAAFRSSAGVGIQCELVADIRDRVALEQSCLPWLKDQASCDLFDDADAFREALPEACLGQLLRTPQ